MWRIFGRMAWSPCCKMLDITHIVWEKKSLFTCLVCDQAPVNPGAGG